MKNKILLNEWTQKNFMVFISGVLLIQSIFCSNSEEKIRCGKKVYNKAEFFMFLHRDLPIDFLDSFSKLKEVQESPLNLALIKARIDNPNPQKISASSTDENNLLKILPREDLKTCLENHPLITSTPWIEEKGFVEKTLLQFKENGDEKYPIGVKRSIIHMLIDDFLDKYELDLITWLLIRQNLTDAVIDCSERG